MGHPKARSSKQQRGDSRDGLIRQGQDGGAACHRPHRTAARKVEHSQTAQVVRRWGFAKVPDATQDVSDPVERCLDRGEAGAGLITARAEEQLHLGRSGHERVVDLVVERHGELADGGESLGPQQLPFRRRKSGLYCAIAADPLQHLRQQVGECLILGEIVVGSLTQRAGGERLVAMRGDQNDPGRLGAATERLEQVEAGDVRELLVQQHHICGVGRCQGVASGRDVSWGGEAVGEEDLPDQPGHGRIVVHQQDSEPEALGAPVAERAHAGLSSRKTRAARRPTTSASAL